MSSNNGLRWQTQSLMNQLKDHIAELEKQPAELLHKSCVNCENWEDSAEMCMKYRARPPAKVIAFGCIDWFNLNDDIPF